MIAVGVDTHKHEHVARALDHLGQVLGHLTVAASLDGYRALAAWLGELGGPIRVGIEGAGSYGAGLCEFLLAEGVDVVEVDAHAARTAGAASPMTSMPCRPRAKS